MNAIFEQSKFVGREIVRLGKYKKTFGSFVEIDEKMRDNKEFLDVFPWIEQGLWNLPMSKDLLCRFKNCHDDLSQINDFDLSIVFVHKFANEDKIFLRHKEDNIYHCVIQSKSLKSLQKNYFYIVTGFCQDNPYVKIYNKMVNK